MNNLNTDENIAGKQIQKRKKLLLIFAAVIVIVAGSSTAGGILICAMYRALMMPM